MTEGKEERFDQHSPLMSRESYDKWLESLPANLCTFCEWRRYQIVLRETDSWIWILNRAPYWRYHTMFVPKRHVEQMSELSVVEIGELFSMYESAVEVFRDFEHDISSDDFNGKFIFFWRFRGRIDGEYVDQRKIDHFHLHLAPDKERMFDPILVNGASNYDYVPLLNQAKSSHRWLSKD